MLRGNVLITGGAGFLGRGIMRRAAREEWDCQFTIVSRDEQKQDACKRRFPNARYVLGDIRDTTAMQLLMSGHHTVIHAAALKYIPEGEFNVRECISVNVDGSDSVATAAIRAGVSRVIGISTDKACQPLNVYGMTKALMERMFVEYDMRTREVTRGTRFTLVRYGNVLGSTGSVVPVFERQLAETGCLEITATEMSRFWITVDQAIDLILAANEAAGGTTVIPDPGAATMLNVANAVFHSTTGRSLTQEHYKVVGTRPGEKFYEDLVSLYEADRAEPYKGGLIALRPVGTPSGAPLGRIITSSEPSRWLDVTEMIAMIRDAESV